LYEKQLSHHSHDSFEQQKFNNFQDLLTSSSYPKTFKTQFAFQGFSKALKKKFFLLELSTTQIVVVQAVVISASSSNNSSSSCSKQNRLLQQCNGLLRIKTDVILMM